MRRSFLIAFIASYKALMFSYLFARSLPGSAQQVCARQ